MLRQLKIRFILLAVISMTVTLAAAFTAVNITLRVRLAARTDTIIEFLYENDGAFPIIPRDEESHIFHDEIPFQTRYISAVLSDDEINSADYSHIAINKIPDITLQIKEIARSGKKKGYYGTYRFGCFEYNSGLMVIAVDCQQDLNILHTLLMITLVTIISCIVAVLIILTVVSGTIIKPFEENRQKQRRFITDAGHELKTPIAVIQSNAEVMEMIDGGNKWIDNIKAQTSRMSNLVKGLIELSKMDEQIISEKEKQRIILTEIAANSVEAFSASAQTKNIQIETHIEPNVAVMGDLEDIVRLVGILLDNAVKYTDERKKIEVTLTQKSKKVVLTVSNTCKGLDRESVKKFFDRFYRSDASRNSDTGGYGIGLSMAQMIVQNHKGKLNVSYTDDERVVFTAEL
ncbi:MAG: HAMP domain-containing sensor histidine kinase [Acutalibacteraceae bacterium]|nr:HAMP domain-containing histidine kinase [Clostridia bacterium]MEE3450504.1 HAMP domain-containing sensor histidine kinase [Acutalibacteraceae bacterium]